MNIRKKVKESIPKVERTYDSHDSKEWDST